MAPEGPLGGPNDLKAPIPLEELLTTYVQDIGKYEALREKHADLAGWVREHCLPKTGTEKPEVTASQDH